MESSSLRLGFSILAPLSELDYYYYSGISEHFDVCLRIWSKKGHGLAGPVILKISLYYYYYGAQPF